MKYRAGTKYVTHWIGRGMLTMAKMNPDSRNDGRNVAVIANWLATSWRLGDDADEHAHRQHPGEEHRGACRTAGPRCRAAGRGTGTGPPAPPAPCPAGRRRNTARACRGSAPRPRTGVEISCSMVPRSHSPRKGQRGEHGRDDHHYYGDQAGHDVVLRLQLGVEPDAGCGRPAARGRPAPPGGRRPSVRSCEKISASTSA